eukprot:gene11980-8253_t
MRTKGDPLLWPALIHRHMHILNRTQQRTTDILGELCFLCDRDCSVSTHYATDLTPSLRKRKLP